jgi:hypothetical protein
VVLAVPGRPFEVSFCKYKSLFTAAAGCLLLASGFPSLAEELTLLEFLDWILTCFKCRPGDWTLLLSLLSFFCGYKPFKSWYRSGFPGTDRFYLDVAFVAVGVIAVEIGILSPDFLTSEYRLRELVSKLAPVELFSSSFFS